MSDRTLPSLNALRSFAAAGKHLSFTAAALELNVTQGAVSRLVRSLEMSLGTTLIRRHGRRLELTPAGSAYHREVTAAFQRIAAATRDLERPAEPTTLIVNVLPTLGMRWLVPRLADFRRRHPGLVVEIVSGDGIPDPDGPWHLAIRYGRPPWPGLEAFPLMSEEIAVVCAPRLAQNLRLGTVPPSLLLQHLTRPQAWRNFFAAAGLPPPDLSHSPGFEHVYMLIEAAARGHGYALVPLFLATEDIAAGRLVCPLSQRLVPTDAYFSLCKPDASSRLLRIFRRWLVEEVGKSTNPTGTLTAG
jgi:LysR family glycine cleavage system transcriptional activator